MSSETTFFSSVFNFDETSKNEFLNIVQYGILAVVLTSLIIKVVNIYSPAFDANKDTIALVIETLLECVLLLVSFVFLHRIIIFIPTLSSTNYLPQNVITIILPFIYVILNQSNLNKKINLIMNRLLGTQENFDNDKKKIKVSQPLSGNIPQTPSLLPQGINTTQIPGSQQSTPPTTSSPDPDYNSMFSGQGNGSMSDFEPVAANSVLGSPY